MNRNESKYFNTARKMDEALIMLLEKKAFEYITIKEICNEAGVNRSTFYLHYQNTSELLAEATKYILHHNEERSEPQVKINLATAQSKLYDGLTVESSRLAVVRTIRGERAAYEFLCSYGEENYFVFLDAVSGEEIAIVNARGIE